MSRNPENKNPEKKKFGKEIKHVDTFFRRHWKKQAILSTIPSITTKTTGRRRWGWDYGMWWYSFSRSWWNNRFNKRMNHTHPNMWALIACLQAEEVIFGQQSLKLKARSQQKKASKTLAMQKRIDNLGTCFCNGDIDRA